MELRLKLANDVWRGSYGESGERRRLRAGGLHVAHGAVVRRQRVVERRALRRLREALLRRDGARVDR